MHMKTRDRWHCTNAVCGCEVLVESSADQDGKNPRCSCGAVMKKRYVSPVLTYLDFLIVEEPAAPAAREGLNRAQ